MTQDPFLAVGPAILAAIIALISLVISKESKLSEFRQIWIDSLRNEVAELLSNILHIKKLIDNSDGSDESRSATFAALKVADNALMLIKLRLNDKESKAQDLLKTIQEIEDFSNAEEYHQERVDELEIDLLRTSKVVLKAEWDRVKAGEPVFRATKYVMWVSLLGLTAALLHKLV